MASSSIKTSSSVSKMVIEIYKDGAFTKKTDEYVVLFNPQTYQLNWEYQFLKTESIKGNTSSPNLDAPPAAVFTMDFLIDGTGIGAAALGRESIDVTDEIWKFLTKTTILERNGKRKPQPPFCRLVWGTLCQRVVVNDVKIDVKMSDRKGFALRANLKTTFSTVFPSSQ